MIFQPISYGVVLFVFGLTYEPRSCTDRVDIAPQLRGVKLKQRWGGKTSLRAYTAVARLPGV